MLFAQNNTEEECMFFHRWVVAKEWNGNKYSECKDCESRRIQQKRDASKPNIHWLTREQSLSDYRKFEWMLPSVPIKEKR